MPIVDTDLHMRLSGGASNSDVNASLGGVKSSTSVTSASTNNLFDQASSAETTDGDIEYRCVYIHNNHGTLTAQNVRIWISSNTPSAGTSIAIGLGTAAVNGEEQTVANESTAPSGVTFSEPSSEGAALTPANLPAGQHIALWVRRTINAGTSAFTDDAATIELKVDTAA